MDAATHAARSQELATKITLLFRRRLKTAQEQYVARLEQAYKDYRPESGT
jgi:hypothetical protein